MGLERKRIVFEETPDGKQIDRVILDPVVVPRDQLQRIVEGQVNSGVPKKIVLYFNPGISVSEPEVLEAARHLRPLDKEVFIRQMVEEMASASRIIIGNPQSQ